jgi:hypothetical protein
MLQDIDNFSLVVHIMSGHAFILNDIFAVALLFALQKFGITNESVAIIGNIRTINFLFIPII